MNLAKERLVLLAKELKRLAGGSVLESEPLANRTTYGVGGPADVFYLPDSTEDLANALPLVLEAGVPVLPIGGGTNMLVKDSGFRGVVISLMEGMKDIVIDKDGGQAEAGASTQVFSRRCQREGRLGMEWGCGIPGTIGGAV